MIVINLDKAKGIAHDIRRQKRAEEFAPLDVQVTIPLFAESAEAQRQEVREKYAVMQTAIDNSETVDQLKEIIK